MDPDNRLDEVNLIEHMLCDIQKSHELLFTTRACRLTIGIVRKRVLSEGISFLTKTLPRLGRAFDNALCHNRLNAASLSFSALPNSELPRFLGEFFSRVFHPDGTVLPDPCADSVRVLRQILRAFSKYALPNAPELEQKVIDSFLSTERDLEQIGPKLSFVEALCTDFNRHHVFGSQARDMVSVTRKARALLERVFHGFDPDDIHPKHGPGAVATKQQLWEKYNWTNIAGKLQLRYPIISHFSAGVGHVVARYEHFLKVTHLELPAKVILVPKDSRGPRLISCEPVDFQWIQQGLKDRLVQHVERHPLTRYNVHFTDQSPNRCGSLLGSRSGKYATLDLKEASDRVSIDLVRLLFPPRIFNALMTVRSSETQLPCGKVIRLRKFAPMGSAVCFPIMAISVWAILTASTADADARESILVYGDDVIVKTALAENAIEQLESYGLKVNRDKCCFKGFFRESCGVDAFKGEDVTPVKFKTVWTSFRSPSSFASWIAYATDLYQRKYFLSYDYIVRALVHLYGPIPSKGTTSSAFCLPEASEHQRPLRRKVNRSLQKLQYLVTEVSTPSIKHDMDGWQMLHRYFAEGPKSDIQSVDADQHEGVKHPHAGTGDDESPFSASTYTKRRTSILVRRWR